MVGVDYLRQFDECSESALRFVPSDSSLAEWSRNYARRHRRRLAADLEMVIRWTDPGARIIEFGAAPYLLSVALQSLGRRVQCLDIAPERFADLVAACALDVRQVNFETDPVPFEDNTFDMVLFNEVFEHLRIDLIATMSEVRRVLKPNGLLLLSTPNHRSLVGIWTLLWHQLSCHVEPDIYREYEKLRLFGHMGHVREYTAREVSVFLAKVGLRTKRRIFRWKGRPGQASLPALTRYYLELAVGTVWPGLRPLFTLICEKAPPRMSTHC